MLSCGGSNNIGRKTRPMSENEQVYEFQPPKPFHPQQRFGSGVQPAALAYPNLAKYYGEQFAVTFTTLDLLDSLAARVALLENQPRETMLDALRSLSLTSEGAGEATLYKPAWWKRVLLRVGMLWWQKRKGK